LFANPEKGDPNSGMFILLWSCSCRAGHPAG